MRRSFSVILLFVAPAIAYGQSGIDACNSSVLPAIPVRPTLTAPLAIELAPASMQIGNSAGVLGQAFDEAFSVDSVLLRIKLEGCRATAYAAPANSAGKADDPAAYKPRTEFDNTPWRFNMSQNGKNMTADEFAAWMTSRGVRVAKGGTRAPVAAEAPPPAPPEQQKN